ncbi:hypothetical protein [Mycolicibacterium llatzerense]|uniref:hypothetical protein n=1 Tax=Mycolicibacterium llatzerense TaxID=280871 RepID=UPI0021B6B5DF|nr:hypothetical protein [Mycolicibacterium llatzerense]
MHVLTWRGIQIAAAERFQRLCMEMAKHPARVQHQMDITASRPASFVEVLT